MGGCLFPCGKVLRAAGWGYWCCWRWNKFNAKYRKLPRTDIVIMHLRIDVLTKPGTYECEIIMRARERRGEVGHFTILKGTLANLIIIILHYKHLFPVINEKTSACSLQKWQKQFWWHNMRKCVCFKHAKNNETFKKRKLILNIIDNNKIIIIIIIIQLLVC